MNFYDKFYELCNAKRLYPATACKQMGLSASATTRWKDGAIPNRSTLFRMAEFFGYNPSDFINYVYSDANIDELESITKNEKPHENILISTANAKKEQPVSQNPINSLLDVLNDPVVSTYIRILDKCTPDQKAFLQSVIEELTDAQRHRT